MITRKCGFNKLHRILSLFAANFDGFRDDESGIYLYLWAVGDSICSHNIVNFSDPHKYLHNSKHWTHNGYEKNLHLTVGYMNFVTSTFSHVLRQVYK